MTFKSQHSNGTSYEKSAPTGNQTSSNEQNVFNVRVKSVYSQNAPTDSKKLRTGGKPMSSKALFDRVLEEKGELSNAQTQWVDPLTLEVTGVSDLALHSYVIEAERHGKTIQIEKSTTIKIIN